MPLLAGEGVWLQHEGAPVCFSKFTECFSKIIKKGDWPKRSSGMAISVNRLKKLLLFQYIVKSNIYIRTTRRKGATAVINKTAAGTRRKV